MRERLLSRNMKIYRLIEREKWRKKERERG